MAIESMMRFIRYLLHPQHAIAGWAIFLWACSTPTSPKQDGTEPSLSDLPPAPPEQQTPPPSANQPAAVQGKNMAGKIHLGSISRGQMAYNLENGTFTQDLDELSLGITAEYFTLKGLDANATQATFVAIANEPGLNSYAGGVSQLPDATYGAIVCESRQPSQDITPPLLEGQTWRCGPDSQKVE